MLRARLLVLRFISVKMCCATLEEEEKTRNFYYYFFSRFDRLAHSSTVYKYYLLWSRYRVEKSGPFSTLLFIFIRIQNEVLVVCRLSCTPYTFRCWPTTSFVVLDRWSCTLVLTCFSFLLFSRSLSLIHNHWKIDFLFGLFSLLCLFVSFPQSVVCMWVVLSRFWNQPQNPEYVVYLIMFAYFVYVPSHQKYKTHFSTNDLRNLLASLLFRFQLYFFPPFVPKTMRRRSSEKKYIWRNQHEEQFGMPKENWW